VFREAADGSFPAVRFGPQPYKKQFKWEITRNLLVFAGGGVMNLTQAQN